MPSAIPYIRFSSARQQSGSSAERQRQMVTSWLATHPEYTQSDLTFEDLGRSGYHGEHIKDGGNFAKLLAAVEAGAIKAGDVILVEAIDRTGRLPSLDMLSQVITPILKAGVSIITLDDNTTYTLDSVAGAQIFLLIAKIQAAHSYSKQLSERVSASYEIRREKARSGEKIKRFAVAWLTTDGELKQHLVPHVKQAFDLYISGVGKNSIANRLRESGVPELALISGPTIDAWLKNKAAIGYWNDIPDVYPAVVSRDVFLLAQNRQQEMKTKAPSRTSSSLLVGLVKCGLCGANYVVHNKDGKPNNMRCLTHHRLKDAGCTNKETIPYVVLSYIFSITASLWLGKALQKTQLSINDKRKLAVEAEIEELSASIRKIVDAIAVVSDNGELVSKLSLLTGKRKLLADDLAILNRTVDGDSGFHEVSLVESDLLLNDPVRLNSLLKMAGYTLTVYPQKLIIAAEEIHPWVYAGVKRSANTTLGYRIHYLGEETVIAPEMKETPDWGLPTGNHIEQFRYASHKAHRLVSVGKPIDRVDIE